MPAYNKSYCEFVGTYTGADELLYTFEMTNSSGTAFKWRTKGVGGSGAYSSYTTVSSYTLNTEISISNGMSIKFTRASKSSYNDGDKWTFRVYPDLKLTSGTNKAFDHLEIIEKGTEKDLIALNSSNGAVTVIKNYESESPEIDEYINIGSVNQKGYDIVSKNKELYVSGGTESPSKWIGYTKNGGFDGELPNYSFISEKTYNEVTLNSTDAATFDDHCFLEGGGATFSVGKIIVGINKNDPTLYVQNIADSKVYTFALGANPLCIRLNTAQFTGTTDATYEINGVAVLTEGREGDYINAIEYWSIPNTGTVGQSANLDKVNHISRPPDQNSNNVGDDYIFTDFLIFCETYDAWTSGKEHHLVLSMARKDGSESSFDEGCLYKYPDGVNDKASGSALDGSDFVDMTVKYGNYPSITQNSGAGFCHVEVDISGQGSGSISDIYTGPNNSGVFESRRIQTVQNYALAFCGYDSNGDNPEFAFTCELDHPTQGFVSGYTTIGAFGLWTDGAQCFLALRWVTSIVGFGTSGRDRAPLLAHMIDWGTTTANFNSAWNSLNTRYGLTGDDRLNDGGGCFGDINLRLDCPPAQYPFYSANGGIDGGQKYFFYLDKNSKNGRAGLIQTRKGNADSVRVFASARTTGSVDLWNSNSLWIFPNTHAQVYTNLTNNTAYTRNQPAYIQQNIPLQDLSSGYMALGDRQPWMTLTGLYPAALESWTSMVPVGGSADIYKENEAEALYKHNLSTDDTTRGVTNLFASTVAWFQTTAPAFHGTTTWAGPTVKKVFYKFALVYDGYQESTLLNTTVSHSDSSDFSKAVTFTIKIAEGETVPLNKRVTAITVYRGDDSEAASSSPENLYRFVTEIPLYKFSLGSGEWTYGLTDSGDVEGTYGALNGIAETMHSLEVKYQLNTALNGYMFIANCNHTQFEDAENVIFRSQPGKYSLFDWSVDFLQVDFVPTAIAGFMGKLYVFGESQLCIVNPESLIIEESIDGIGCIGPKAVKTTPSGLYWFDQTNIYNSKPQIAKIGTNIKAQENYGWNLISADKKKEAVMGYDGNRQSILIFFEFNSTYKVWAFYAETSRWDLWETSHRVYDSVTASDGYPILLLDEGRIQKYTAGSNKRDWVWNSKKLSLGTDTNYKKIRVAKVDATSRAGTSLSYITDDESSYQAGTDVSDNYGTNWTGVAKKIASNHSKLRWIKLKVEGDNNTSSSNRRAYALGLVYKPKKPK